MQDSKEMQILKSLIQAHPHNEETLSRAKRKLAREFDVVEDGNHCSLVMGSNCSHLT